MQEWSPVHISASTPNFSRTTRWPSRDHFFALRLQTALLVQSALALRHDHLGPFLRGGERLFERVAHGGYVVSARDGANPFHAHSAHRIGDGKLGSADGILGRRRQNILPAGGRRVAVVHHHQQAVARLKTALPTPLVRPLCQNPPSPMMLMVRLPVSVVLKAAAPAQPRP